MCKKSNPPCYKPVIFIAYSKCESSLSRHAYCIYNHLFGWKLIVKELGLLFKSPFGHCIIHLCKIVKGGTFFIFRGRGLKLNMDSSLVEEMMKILLTPHRYPYEREIRREAAILGKRDKISRTTLIIPQK